MIEVSPARAAEHGAGTDASVSTSLCGDGPSGSGLFGVVFSPGAQPFEHAEWTYIAMSAVHCRSDVGPSRFIIVRDGELIPEVHCLTAGEAVPVGNRGIYGPPSVPQTLPGRITHTESGGTCVPPEEPVEPAAPFDAVHGAVVAARRHGAEVKNPLAGARWELWFEGRCDGSAGSPVELCPVRTEIGVNNEPAGPPATGYLDDLGRLSDGDDDIDFVYPQSYDLADRRRWHGCVEAQSPVAHLLGNACAEDKLVLRVFPINRDSSIRVRERDNDYPDDISPMITIPMGLDFQRPAEQRVHEAVSPGAHAYSGALNGRRIYLAAADIRLNERGDTSYNQFTGEIAVDVARAPHSSVEHEFGHHVMRMMYGRLPSTPNCAGHDFHLPSGEACAFVEGFAEFFAVLAENDPGETSMSRRTFPGQVNDVEKCLIESYGIRCQSGPTVEGRVAATLYDLVDVTPHEREDGKGDHVSVPVALVLDVVATHRPTTFAEFQSAWLATSGRSAEEQEAMWLNTLGYSGQFDALNDGSHPGSWDELTCDAGRCVGPTMTQSAPVEGLSPEMTWYIGSAVRDHDSPRTGTWDIWVHLPATAASGLDTTAVYVVETKSGPQQWTVDQSTQVGRWVRLSPDTGFVLDPADDEITVTLRQVIGHGKSVLLSDGLLVVPRG